MVAVNPRQLSPNRLHAELPSKVALSSRLQAIRGRCSLEWWVGGFQSWPSGEETGAKKFTQFGVGFHLTALA